WVTRLEPARVLDVGCGRGWAVRALRERGISAWGIDSSPSLAALTVIPGAFIRATADRLPFANGMFDVVLCTDVLAHIPDRFVARTLRDLVRVCGGYLVATIDCVDPTKEGHLTIRPRRWWLERLVEAGAEPVSALEDNLERERVCQRRDGLELVVCRTRPGDAGVVPLRWEVSEAKQPGAAARWPAAALSGRAV
ncbi:MAG TPA: hypothetical protein DEP84_05635, partial [Chloroflexi bacterium]|nr:hypothetical protein [Chloroflexota bacterium]